MLWCLPHALLHTWVCASVLSLLAFLVFDFGARVPLFLEVVPVKRLIKPLLEVFESLVLNVSHGRDLCFRLANSFLDSVLHVLNINTWIDKPIALSSKNLLLRSHFMEVDELAANPPASQALVSGKGLWVASFWLGVRSPHELSSGIPIGLGVLTELNKFAVFWA